jgi:hypothetical protein
MAANWFNRFTKWWASSGTLQDPTDPQAAAGWSYIGQAPPTVEQFNSVQQWNDQKDNWLYNQIASVLTWGGQTAIDTNPNTLRDAISGKMKTVLTASVNYYVDLAGNDSTGNGTVGNPWRTIQFAITWITNHIDAAGYNVNIQLKTAGTYAQAYFGIPINGNFMLTGDKLNPRNYIVKNLDGPAVVATQSAVVILQGISLEATGQYVGGADYRSVGHGIYAARSGVVYMDAVAFGPCTHVQISCETGAVVYPLNGTSTTLSVYGSAQSFATGGASGIVVLQGLPTTFTNNPNYSVATIQAAQAGSVNAYGWMPTGTVTGSKWSVYLNGVMVTQNAGANIPGSTAGTVGTGGQIT